MKTPKYKVGDSVWVAVPANVPFSTSCVKIEPRLLTGRVTAIKYTAEKGFSYICDGPFKPYHICDGPFEPYHFPEKRVFKQPEDGLEELKELNRLWEFDMNVVKECDERERERRKKILAETGAQADRILKRKHTGSWEEDPHGELHKTMDEFSGKNFKWWNPFTW